MLDIGIFLLLATAPEFPHRSGPNNVLHALCTWCSRVISTLISCLNATENMCMDSYCCWSVQLFTCLTNKITARTRAHTLFSCKHTCLPGRMNENFSLLTAGKSPSTVGEKAQNWNITAFFGKIKKSKEVLLLQHSDVWMKQPYHDWGQQSWMFLSLQPFEMEPSLPTTPWNWLSRLEFKQRLISHLF